MTASSTDTPAREALRKRNRCARRIGQQQPETAFRAVCQWLYRHMDRVDHWDLQWNRDGVLGQAVPRTASASPADSYGR